jgi:hypothetical protein
MDAHRPLETTPVHPIRQRPPGRGEVIQLDAYRRRVTESQGDVILNVEWDRLAQLAEEAWCWRDPESLAALGACVARLGLRSLEEWTL